MEELLQELAQAFADYRLELEDSERKRRPADGLFGFGHSPQQDACHERFDGRVERIAGRMAEAGPSPGEAERAVRMILFPEGETPWPLAAQWMLRAAERHTLALIPFLGEGAAASIGKEYGRRYPVWDRLPAQKQVYKALQRK